MPAFRIYQDNKKATLWLYAVNSSELYEPVRKAIKQLHPKVRIVRKGPTFELSMRFSVKQKIIMLDYLNFVFN